MLVFLYALLLALEQRGIANVLAHSDRNLNFKRSGHKRSVPGPKKKHLSSFKHSLAF